MDALKSFWQNLFGKKEEAWTPAASPSYAPPPDDLPEEIPEADEMRMAEVKSRPISEATQVSGDGGSFTIGWVSDVGRVRGHNEDAMFVFMGEHIAETPIPVFGLFILADGMGGHQAGEVASAMAVQVTASHLMTKIYGPLLARLEPGADQPSLNEVMRSAVAQANQCVNQDAPGSGSTLTCGMLLGDRLFVGHVGDSRAYLLRQNEPPKRLTNDHSLVNRLVEMGQLTIEEAAVHPQRNVLYRAIGQGGNLEIDVLTVPIQSGDKLLLCSDGLWGMIEEDVMWDTIAQADSPQNACRQLVEKANEAGGNDNITVILVDVQHV